MMTIGLDECLEENKHSHLYWDGQEGGGLLFWHPLWHFQLFAGSPTNQQRCDQSSLFNRVYVSRVLGEHHQVLRPALLSVHRAWCEVGTLVWCLSSWEDIHTSRMPEFLIPRGPAFSWCSVMFLSGDVHVDQSLIHNNKYSFEARHSLHLFLFFFLSPDKLCFIGFIFNHLPACVQTSVISPGRKFCVCLSLTHTSWVVINFSVCLVRVM